MVTSSDDRQPGGSGTCSDCETPSDDCICKTDHEGMVAFTDELKAIRLSKPGGSGADSGWGDLTDPQEVMGEDISEEMAELRGGSGAGSTVEDAEWERRSETMLALAQENADLRAAIEVAQRERDEAREQWDIVAVRYESLWEEHEQSRATEAELRAKVERYERALVAEHARMTDTAVYMNWRPPEHFRSRLKCEHPLCVELRKPALDAADTPAARGGTSQDAPNRPLTGPSAHGSTENDHSALETAEGPQGANP